jgi:hypothetical protein
MKNLIVSFVLFLVSLTSFGQSFNSTAVLKTSNETFYVNDSVAKQYPVKDVNVVAKITQDSIVMIIEYPKHASVTYKVVKFETSEYGITTFECVTSNGAPLNIVYGSPDYSDKEVFFVINFKPTEYYYTYKGLKQ